jgi:hypothetical protein
MATFEFDSETYYIDGRLKNDFDKKVIPDLSKKDKDRVFIVDGAERSGKSVFAMIKGAYMASQLKSPFNITNICMTPEEFRNKIESSTKNEVIVYDEAHRGMGSARALSEINNILKDLMMEMGQRNLFVIIVLLTFFLLEKYVALFRAAGLFHVYERKAKRGFWCFFNNKNKLKLYMRGKKEFNYNCMRWPNYRGRFLNQYPIDEKEYRAKKGASFKGRKRTTRNEQYLEQRNLCFYILNKEYGLNPTDISKMLKYYGFKMTNAMIGKVLNEFKPPRKI